MNYAKGQNLVKLRIIVAVKPTNTLSMHLYKKDLLRLFSKLRLFFFFFEWSCLDYPNPVLLGTM